MNLIRTIVVLELFICSSLYANFTINPEVDTLDKNLKLASEVSDVAKKKIVDITNVLVANSSFHNKNVLFRDIFGNEQIIKLTENNLIPSKIIVNGKDVTETFVGLVNSNISPDVLNYSSRGKLLRSEKLGNSTSSSVIHFRDVSA